MLDQPQVFKDDRKATRLMALHGAGMADERPFLPLHPDFDPACEGRFEAGRVICVESLIGAKGSESVKLETQTVVTESGVGRLDTFPWEGL